MRLFCGLFPVIFYAYDLHLLLLINTQDRFGSVFRSLILTTGLPLLSGQSSNIVRSKEMGGVRMLNIAFLDITAAGLSVSPDSFFFENSFKNITTKHYTHYYYAL